MMADAFRSGPEGALEVEDFFDELLKRDRAKGERVLGRTRKLLPKGEEQTFLRSVGRGVGGMSRETSADGAKPVRSRNFSAGTAATGSRSSGAEDDTSLLAAGNVARPRVRPPAPERREPSSENVPRPRVKPATVDSAAQPSAELRRQVRVPESAIEATEAMRLGETPFADEMHNEIALREAAVDGYTTDRRADPGGALGRYQLTEIARKDIGLQDAQGNWTGKFGVHGPDEFLADPVAQERAMAAFLQRIEVQLKAPETRSWHRIGTRINGIREEFVVTDSGLMAAGHRKGTTAVVEYFDDMEKSGWVSSKERWLERHGEKKTDIFLAIETRLREFENVQLRRGNK